MHSRTIEQAQFALDAFIVERLNGRIPYAINTQKFVEFIAQTTGWELRSRIVLLGMSSLRGILLRNELEKKALILIAESEANNLCWRRFTAIKEVSHLFLRLETTIECTNAQQMIESLILQNNFFPSLLPDSGAIEALADKLSKDDLLEAKGLFDAKHLYEAIASVNPHGVAEISAIVFAIEIMIPLAHRETLASRAKTQSLKKMATDLRVPAILLEHRLKNWEIVCFN